MVQLHSNPALGTYNSQSGVIQGILSQMKDDFEKELEDSAKEEEEAESQHAQLMETKRADLALLESTLIETKVSCSEKAKQWSARSQSRTEELYAIDEAVGILTSPEAKATFENSSTTLLQISEATEPAKERTAAYDILKKAAVKAHS